MRARVITRILKSDRKSDTLSEVQRLTSESIVCTYISAFTCAVQSGNS